MNNAIGRFYIQCLYALYIHWNILDFNIFITADGVMYLQYRINPFERSAYWERDTHTTRYSRVTMQAVYFFALLF